MQRFAVMRTLLLMVILAGGCKDRPAYEDPAAGAKVVQAPDDDFRQTRLSFQTRARARLAQLDARITEMGEDASVHVRAQRDELAKRVDQISEQGESRWDDFRAVVEDKFDEIERGLGGY